MIPLQFVNNDLIDFFPYTFIFYLFAILHRIIKLENNNKDFILRFINDIYLITVYSLLIIYNFGRVFIKMR